MPVARMRMRPWLESKINSKSIPGLAWINEEKTMFTIPWKHAARHGWEVEKDACLFKSWAIHTGKYTAGQEPDPKTWKANFRCAMNSLPDIEEVKDKSINKGHQAMRVFRMLPITPKSRDKRSKAKELKTRRKRSMVQGNEESEDNSDTLSSTDESVGDETLSPQENTIDSTVNTAQPITGAMSMPPPVPDWTTSVDVEPLNSFDNFLHRFEVSPVHSSDYDEDDEIRQICRQLERDAHYLEMNNEFKTSPSRWSDSSGDDADEMPQYTTLGVEPSCNLWLNLFKSTTI